MNQNCPLSPNSRVVSYARDSGGGRQERSVPQQLSEYSRFCEKHDLILVRSFADAARPGSTTAGRIEFDAMVTYLEQEPRQVDGALFWDSSRSWRNMADGQYYRSKFRRMGYVLVYVSEFIPNTRMGRVWEVMKDASNEEYLERLSLEVKRGHRDLIHRAGDDGPKFHPGGFPPKGYRTKKIPIGRHRDGTIHYGNVWEPDPITFHLVCKAWAMRANGNTHREIHEATELYENVTSWSAFFDNETYLGTLKCSEIRVENAHPPACTQEQWDRVQAMKQPYRAGGAYPRQVRSKYLLSGKARCTYCSGPVCGNASSDRYYICAERKQMGRHASCQDSTYLKASMVDGAVLETILSHILTPANTLTLIELVNQELSATLDTIDANIHAKRHLIAQLDKVIDHLLDQIEVGQSVADRLKQREKERFQLVAELKQLETMRPCRIEIDKGGLQFAIAEMRNMLTLEDIKAAQQVLRGFVDTIYLGNNGGELHYRIPVSNQTLFSGLMRPIASLEFSYT